MNMYTTTDTTPCKSIQSWDDIDFGKAERCVEKLQKRIALAFDNGNINKVESLQHTLIHSFYAKALAIRRVTTNKGRNTPGVDDKVLSTSLEKFNAIYDLKRRGYKPNPLKRVFIPKKDNTSRPLSVPTMKDRAMQTLYKFALEPIAELTADDCSFAYRPNRSARGAIIRCIDILSNSQNTEWILKADIKSCFDNISHEWIMEHIPIDKTILKKFLSCGYVYDTVLYSTERGIPQGGSLSSVICNMTLDGLQAVLCEDFNDSIRLIRFADDILIICESQSISVQCVVHKVNCFLSERGLVLSAEKTYVSTADKGVEFLGWKIYIESKDVIAIPSKKNVHLLLSKVVNELKVYQITPNYNLFMHLDKMIRGWFNYYSGIAVIQSLFEVEYDIISCMTNYNVDKDTVELVKKLFKEFDSTDEIKSKKRRSKNNDKK